VRNNWNIDHLDVVTAFLDPDMDDNTLLIELQEGLPHIESLMDDCPEGKSQKSAFSGYKKHFMALSQHHITCTNI